MIDHEGEAAWHRRRAAKEYRDQLRNQLLRLWQPGRPILPEQEANPEADIRNKLTPWLMGVLSADTASTSAPAGNTGQMERGTGSEPHRLPTPAQLADLAGKLRKWADEIDARGLIASLRKTVGGFLHKSAVEPAILAGWYDAAFRQDPESELCDRLKSAAGLLGRLMAKSQRPTGTKDTSKELRWLADQFDNLTTSPLDDNTSEGSSGIASSERAELIPTIRSHAFISYSHKDKRWLDDLLIHLKPYLRDGSVTAWSDQQIAPGSKWFLEIKAEIAVTKVAVLLVAPDFLASEFIHAHELGPLLKEAELGGVRIVWVPVRACSYRKTPLKDYQAVVDPAKPLANMKADRDKAWVAICEKIEEAVKQA